MRDPLYYTDSYLWRFRTRVVKRQPFDDLTRLVLEDTAFYPESGGQPADRGRIGFGKVVDVQIEDQEIVHWLEGPSVDPQAEVECEVDGTRRFDHMQQHSGQHLLSQCFLREIGAQTRSFHLGEEDSTIDLEIEKLSDEEAEQVERKSQLIIEQNRPIRVRFVDAKDTQDAGLRRESQRSGRLRLVEIDDYDASACGGTHCGTTGEVGLVKILGWERIRGNARVHFLCGRRAVEDYRHRCRVLRDTALHLSADWKEVADRVTGQTEEIRRLRKERDALSDLLLDREAAVLAERAEKVGQLEVCRWIYPQRDGREINRLATVLLRGVSRRVALLAGVTDRVYLVFACSADLGLLDMGLLVRQAAALLGGRGGGAPDRGQGGGGNVERVDDALLWAEEEIRRLVS